MSDCDFPWLNTADSFLLNLNQSESGGLKRKADVMPELDDFEQAKRAKLIALAPSDASKPSYYQKIQRNTSQRILDDRPLADVDVPLAPLLHSGEVTSLIYTTAVIMFLICRTSIPLRLKPPLMTLLTRWLSSSKAKTIDVTKGFPC